MGRTKQLGTETLGDLWKGEGWTYKMYMKYKCTKDIQEVHGVYKMDITGTFRKESREFEGGRIGVD